MAITLLAALLESTLFSDLLYGYGSQYAGRILVLATLSAITIYRREISCNHCYAASETQPAVGDTALGSSLGGNDHLQQPRRIVPGEGEEEAPESDGTAAGILCATSIDPTKNNLLAPLLRSSARADWDDECAEELLEGLGLSCSGASLLPLIMSITKLLVAQEISIQPGPSSKPISMAMDNPNWYKQCGQLFRHLITADAHFGDPSLSSFAPTVPPRAVVSPTSQWESQAWQHPPHSPTALPADAQIHILSFLHPCDVIQYGCLNRACKQLVHAEEDDEQAKDDVRGVRNQKGSSSMMSWSRSKSCRSMASVALWKSLWYRDYAWLITEWSVGKQAWERSDMEWTQVHFSKRFYFEFAWSYLNYILAGNNHHTQEHPCLVALGGHIYDMTNFLARHPGSPEIVMVYAGTDASHFVGTINHSRGALRKAQALCLAVDMSLVESNNNNDANNHHWGIRPTSFFHSEYGNSYDENDPVYSNPSIMPLPPCAESPTIHIRSIRNFKKSTLAFIGKDLSDRQQQYQRMLTRCYPTGSLPLVGEIHVYYDPFRAEFRAWYTNTSMETIFLGTS